MGTLKIKVNPYNATDAKGRPCCAVAIDPFDEKLYDPIKTPGGLVGGYVGAQIAEVRLLRPGDANALQSARNELIWIFDDRPIEVTDSPYYRRNVTDGMLIAADEATATLCRVTYRDPATILAETKARNSATEALWLNNPAE